ncbi:hypothetical protein B0H14DRAFT_3486772 [Mycena olivaceomarginata]|nr:hypothetical protein B0H14DRAFT_3486772 [Mycena olivaceomarginata]
MIASKLGFWPLPPQFPKLPPANKSRPEDPRPIITTRKQPPRSCLDPIPSPPHHPHLETAASLVFNITSPSPPHHPRPESAAPLVFTSHIPNPRPHHPRPESAAPARVYITNPSPAPSAPPGNSPPHSCLDPIPIPALSSPPGKRLPPHPRSIIHARKDPPQIPAPSAPAPIPSQTRLPRDHLHAAPPSCECRPSAFTCLPTLTHTSPSDHSSFALAPAPLPSFFLSPLPAPPNSFRLTFNSRSDFTVWIKGLCTSITLRLLRPPPLDAAPSPPDPSGLTAAAAASSPLRPASAPPRPSCPHTAALPSHRVPPILSHPMPAASSAPHASPVLKYVCPRPSRLPLRRARNFELDLDANVLLEEDGDKGGVARVPCHGDPLACGVLPPQLHDTAANIKCAQSGSVSASASVHTFNALAPSTPRCRQPTASGCSGSGCFALGIDAPHPSGSTCPLSHRAWQLLMCVHHPAPSTPLPCPSHVRRHTHPAATWACSTDPSPSISTQASHSASNASAPLCRALPRRSHPPSACSPVHPSWYRHAHPAHGNTPVHLRIGLASRLRCRCTLTRIPPALPLRTRHVTTASPPIPAHYTFPAPSAPPLPTPNYIETCGPA